MKNWKRCLRYRLAQRDGWKCHYCDERLTLATSTLDHVVPRLLGGTNHPANLRLACLTCNRAKAAHPPHVFYALLMQGLVA